MKQTIEAVKPIFAVFTLTAVGIKTCKLDSDYAQELAQKLVDSNQPGFLDGKVIGNGYTRAEMGVLCYQYLIDSGAGHEVALDRTAAGELVDEFWSTIFPDSVHTPRFDLYLPELTGNPEDVKQAEPVRRKQLVDLLLLKALINPDADYKGLAFCYIDEIIKRPLAKDWLSTSLVRYTPEWLAMAFAELFEQAKVENRRREG